MTDDLIIGTHSIREALKNPKRESKRLFASSDALDALSTADKTLFKSFEMTLLSKHDFQERYKKELARLGFEYTRPPSGLFLLTAKLEVLDMTWLYSKLETKSLLKILCLDQVTDVHNAAAIMRTMAFYGMHALLVSGKDRFGASPSFFRVASGATEHVPIIYVSSLVRTISKLQEKGLFCLGLTEEAAALDKKDILNKPFCIVLGAEDRGISNALLRILQHKASLIAYGEISTLNVSVAAAISLEKLLS